MPGTLSAPVRDTRPRAWQQGDRVKLRPGFCHTNSRYRLVKDSIGVIESVYEPEWNSAGYSTVNARFEHESFPHGVLVTDILLNHFEAAPELSGADEGVSDPKRRSPLNMKVVKDERTEAQKQAEGIAWLEARGYTVLVVGQYMKKVHCEDCSTWFWPKGFGNSVGFPDTAVFHSRRWSGPDSGRVPVLLQEWKKDEKADRRPEQVKLAVQGASTFVWSLQMCLADLVEFEQAMGFEPHPDALEYLERHTPKTAEVTA